jgi:hypothetical protein
MVIVTSRPWMVPVAAFFGRFPPADRHEARFVHAPARRTRDAGRG